MSSEPKGTIPNGSGRPAHIDDDALINLVAGLVQQLGKLPTLDHIVKVAGGCQRSRAVAARRIVAEQITLGELNGQVRLPDAVEIRHRQMLMEWLELAREQIRPVLKQIVDDAESKSATAELAAQDARDKLEVTQAKLAALCTEGEDHKSQLAQLNERISQLSASEARWKARAEERAVTIRHLSKLNAGGVK